MRKAITRRKTENVKYETHEDIQTKSENKVATMTVETFMSVLW